jgi:hypothetical protein
MIVLANSIVYHCPLVAYGLNISESGALWVAAGIVGASFAIFALAFYIIRLRRFRTLTFTVAGIAGAFLLAFSAVGTYGLEVKYEKGESTLELLAIFGNNLPFWQARSSTLRTGILRAANLSPLPIRTPLNPVIHSQREHNGYSVENVILETIPGFFLAGNLYSPLPVETGRKRPVVLIPQGHFRNDRFNEDTQQLAATFARMGALAILYDMTGRGESTQVSHHDPRALTLQLWNSMRVLDFMLGLPDADATRVGMTGASGGGTQTFLCAAVDDRVTAVAPVVMVSSWVYGGCECESGLPIHATREYRTNNAEITALTAPRPLLIVSIDEDWTRSVPEREFPYIRQIYHLFGRKDLVRNVHLSGEHHDYGPSKRQAVYHFFAEHLRLSVSGREINESENTIESRETMSSFDRAHPLPKNALRGWDEVMQTLHAQ